MYLNYNSFSSLSQVSPSSHEVEWVVPVTLVTHNGVQGCSILTLKLDAQEISQKAVVALPGVTGDTGSRIVAPAVLTTPATRMNMVDGSVKLTSFLVAFRVAFVLATIGTRITTQDVYCLACPYWITTVAMA